jgi:hypothetical protein
MARGLMTALQAALAGVSGGASGYVRYQEQERQRLREEEERKRREAMDLITFGERAIEPGPLATRAPAGGAGPIAGREAGAAPPPPSAIPMPTGPVDFGEAERQLGQEESRPSGTTPLQIGDRTLYIPIGQRARDIKRSEQAEASAAQLADALARAEAVGQLQRRQEKEVSDEKERTAYNALKRFRQVQGEFDPTYGQYSADLEDYRAVRRTQRASGGGGDAMSTFIDKQVADEVTRMAREGYEAPNPAYGSGPNQSLFAPKTIRVRYKPEELQNQAREIRSGLRSAFGIGETGGGRAQEKPTITATEAAQLEASGYSRERIRSQYTIAPAGSPAASAAPAAPAMAPRDSLTAAPSAAAPARADTSAFTARLSPRQMMEAAGLQRPSDIADSLTTRRSAAPAATPRPSASRPAAPAQSAAAMIAALNNPRELAASRQALAARTIPAGYPMPSVAYPETRPRTIPRVEMPPAPNIPGASLPELGGSPVARAMAIAGERSTTRPAAPRASLRTADDVSSAMQRMASLQSRLAMLRPGSTRYKEVEQELSVLGEILREAEAKFPNLFTP